MAKETTHEKEKKQKTEIKEQLNRQRQAEVLRGWLDALEGEHDLELTLENKRHTIPAEAFAVGKAELEYEVEEGGEYELELSVKWR